MRYTDVNYIPRYVQAKNITKEMKRILFPLGSRILFLMGCGPIEEAMIEKIDYSFSHSMSEAIQDKSSAAAVASRLAQYYDSMNRPMAYQYVKTDGLETTSENAEKLWNENKAFHPEVIVGVGGGKTIDLAKEVSQKALHVKIVMVPTSLSTNASGTRLSLIYNEEGSQIVKVGIMPRMQDFLIVDPEVVKTAPAALLAAGLGDCISADYEAIDNAERIGVKRTGTSVGWNFLESNLKVLREKGISAYTAAKAHQLTPDLEIVMEQIAMNGVATSLVGSVGLSHAIDEVLDRFESARKFSHGQHVGYGVIAQMIWAGRAIAEIYDYIDFARALDFPLTLEDFGLGAVTDEQFEKACAFYQKSPTRAYCPLAFSNAEIIGSLRTADELVKGYLGF